MNTATFQGPSSIFFISVRQVKFLKGNELSSFLTFGCLFVRMTFIAKEVRLLILLVHAALPTITSPLTYPLLPAYSFHYWRIAFIHYAVIH